MRWEDLVEQHGPLVWRTAYRLLGNEADAADCYQDAFAAALAVARRQEVRNWPAMLRRLATNHALASLRRRARRRATDDGLAGVASSRSDPSTTAAGAELIDWVRTALAQLPEPHARAFVLTCVDGLSYEQAAGEMDVSP